MCYYETKKCEECEGFGFHLVEAGRRGPNDPECYVTRQDCEACAGTGEVEAED